MVGVLIAVIAAAGLLVVLMAFSGRHGSGTSGSKDLKGKNKNRSLILKECTRKLSKDPHNVDALLLLSRTYYEDGAFDKALPLLQTLFKLMTVHTDIDQMGVSRRYGVSAFRCQKYDDAMVAFSKIAHNNPKDYDANFYVGRILLEKKDFEKAIMCFKRAMQINPDTTEINEPMGLSLFGAKKYKECLNFLKKALDDNPENKELLFDLAIALEETGMGDKALTIFTHLRPDPQFGPQSCIECGVLHEKQGMKDKALKDYEIALKLETISPESKLNVFYRMAQIYLQTNNIAKALTYLKQIQAITSNYKDVGALISRYQELNQNTNLQAYLMSGTSDFVVLCRKFIAAYYPEAFVKIDDVNVGNDGTEIQCTVDAGKWSDTELFRFFRNSGSIGELYIRDCHTKMRDIKCERGFCVTAGTFTEEAKKYVDGRPIDLIEKDKLVQILKKIE